MSCTITLAHGHTLENYSMVQIGWKEILSYLNLTMRGCDPNPVCCSLLAFFQPKKKGLKNVTVVHDKKNNVA